MSESKRMWKTDVNSAKKIEFLKELEQLKFQSKKLGREKLQSYSKRSDYRTCFKELEEIEVMLNEEMIKERNKIDQHLGKIKNKVNVFQNQLKDVKPTPEFVEKLRENMEEIESTINDFKQQQRKMFESLIADENNTSHEIEITLARIETISSANSVIFSAKARAVRPILESNLPPEVKAFEKYVAQFGAEGGWDEYDHGTFLKIRNKMKGKPSFLRVAANNIPGRLYDDIKRHEEWFRKFVELRDEKKNAILEWKMKKENEKEENFKPKTTEDVDAMKKIQEEKERKERAEKEKKKKELEEWKARKAEQAKLEMEEIERNEIRKKRLQEKDEMRMKEIREAARERLKMKKDEKEREVWRMEAEHQEMKAMKAHQAETEIMKFQSRDQNFLQLKQREKKRKDEAVKKRNERLEKARAKIKVESDRNRLYQPTDSHIQRSKRQTEVNTERTPMITLQHRAVPSWRQGL